MSRSKNDTPVVPVSTFTSWAISLKYGSISKPSTSAAPRARACAADLAQVRAQVEDGPAAQVQHVEETAAALAQPARGRGVRAPRPGSGCRSRCRRWRRSSSTACRAPCHELLQVRGDVVGRHARTTVPPASACQRLGRHGWRRTQHQHDVVGAVEPVQRVVHEHARRAVVEVQQTRQVREVVVEVDAVHERGAPRPGGAGDVTRTAREVQHGATLEVDLVERRRSAARPAGPRARRRAPLGLLAAPVARRRPGSTAPSAASAAGPRGARLGAGRGRSSRSRPACRLRAPRSRTQLGGRVEAPTWTLVRNPQWAAPGRSGCAPAISGVGSRTGATRTSLLARPGSRPQARGRRRPAPSRARRRSARPCLARGGPRDAGRDERSRVRLDPDLLEAQHGHAISVLARLRERARAVYSSSRASRRTRRSARAPSPRRRRASRDLP